MTASLQDTYSKYLTLGREEPIIDSVSSMAFSPSGELLLSGSDGGNLCIWDTSKGELVYRKTWECSITTVFWMPTSNTSFIFGTRFGAYVVEDFEVLQSPVHQILLGFSGTVYCLDFDPGQGHLAVGISEEVHIARRLDNLDAYTTVIVFPQPPKIQVAASIDETRLRARSMHFFNNGRRLIVSYLVHGVVCWDLKTRKGVWKITPPRPNCIIAYSALSPNKRFLLLSNLRYGADLYEVGTGKHVRSFKQKGYELDNNHPLMPAFIHGGKLVICGSNVGDVQLWQTANAESHESLYHADGPVQIVCAYQGYISRFIATACIENEGKTVIRVWRAWKGQKIYRALSDAITSAKYEDWMKLFAMFLLCFGIVACLRQPLRGQLHHQVMLLIETASVALTALRARTSDLTTIFMEAFRQYALEFIVYLHEVLAFPIPEGRPAIGA